MLLTIVLTTSTFIATGVIPVNLPEASQSDTDALKSQLIEVDRQGNIYFNARPVTLSGLEFAMAPIHRTAPVLIRADQRIALQGFVDILDLVKHLGFSQIRLQTEQKS